MDYTQQLATPGQSIGIEQAEQQRQSLFIAGLKDRDPVLYSRALATVVALKKAAQDMTQMRLDLAAALTPSQVQDALDALDRDAMGVLKQPIAMLTLRQVEQMSAPHGIPAGESVPRMASVKEQGKEATLEPTAEKVPAHRKN